MGKGHWRGHETWSFAACVPKHHALVSGALGVGFGAVNALRNVRGLFHEGRHDLELTGLTCERVAMSVCGVSHVVDDVVDYLSDIELSRSRQFTGNKNEIRL